MATLTLKHPFDLGSRRYETLTLRRARAGDLRILDKSGALALLETMQDGGSLAAGVVDKLMPFLASVCDVTEDAIERLDAEDLFALYDKIEEVLPGSPLPAAKKPPA